MPFTQWKYSGQISPKDLLMEIEVHIKTIQAGPKGLLIQADASLWKDGIRIYQVTDAALLIEEYP